MSGFFAPRGAGAGAGAGAGVGAGAGDGTGVSGGSGRGAPLLPWVEKYRPKNVSDVAFQKEVIKSLKSSIADGNLPHLLFYGPPGTGKTSTALALARELFGDQYDDRIKELNASDERGISVVRNKVKFFAKRKVKVVPGIPNFKLLVLDEADALTPDAQAALRRTLELSSSVTRVCFICNYVSRIIEPLASRCAKFRFQPLDTESVSARLRHVAAAEGLDVTDDVVDALQRVSNGDLRKAISLMQATSQLYGADAMTVEAVVDVAGVVPDADAERLWAAVKEPRFASVRAVVTNLTSQGYALAEVLDKLHQLVLDDDKLLDCQKADMAEVIAEADKQLADGADEGLQLLHVASALQVVANQAAAGA